MKDEDITLDQFDITHIEIPEAAIYLDKTRNIGQVFQTLREASAIKIIGEAEAYKTRLLNQVEVDKTEQFIEIMKKYPDILKYYQIEKINPAAKSVIIMNDRANENEITKNIVKQQMPADKPTPPVEESGKIDAIKK